LLENTFIEKTRLEYLLILQTFSFAQIKLYMKPIFTFIAILFITMGAFAQDPIKNYSFENWSTDTMGKLAPDDWTFNKEFVAKNALKRNSSGTQGSYALFLGSFNNAGDVEGAEVQINDTIIEVPGSITFDYIVQNNNTSFLNGLSVEFYFYDSTDNFIKDYTWNSGFNSNNSTFRKAELAFAKSVIANAKNYLMRIIYYNIGGSTTEYGVIDNLKFNKTSGNVSVPKTQNNTINFYPNPATATINFTAGGNENINKIIVTAIDGRQTTFASETFVNNAIDISALANGIYFVTAHSADGTPLHSQKIVVNK
jgi:hypothetical protein